MSRQWTTCSVFLANPDLSLIPGDTSTLSPAPLHPHVVLLERFPTKSDFYGWDVWYANDDPDDAQWIKDDPFVYLPVVMKNYY